MLQHSLNRELYKSLAEKEVFYFTPEESSHHRDIMPELFLSEDHLFCFEPFDHWFGPDFYGRIMQRKNPLTKEETKKIAGYVETHNLTIDVEPAMYPTDHVYLCPAERMPTALKGGMDLIVSHMAFRYFQAPDLALENCLQALSIGGEAMLSVDTDIDHQFIFNLSPRIKEYAGRLADKYARLKSLRQARNDRRADKARDIPKQVNCLMNGALWLK